MVMFTTRNHVTAFLNMKIIVIVTLLVTQLQNKQFYKFSLRFNA